MFGPQVGIHADRIWQIGIHADGNRRHEPGVRRNTRNTAGVLAVSHSPPMKLLPHAVKKPMRFAIPRQPFAGLLHPEQQHGHAEQVTQHALPEGAAFRHLQQPCAHDDPERRAKPEASESGQVRCVRGKVAA